MKYSRKRRNIAERDAKCEKAMKYSRKRRNILERDEI
jgi:hypothetical protein